MKILISNDDGIGSYGLKVLYDVAKKFGDVVVVAPHRERSTSGHGLTLHKPLRIHQIDEGWYETSGTPGDCVHIAARHILTSLPDLVLSGMNLGLNLGADIFYSGTLAVAREGALLGVRSLAFSQPRDKTLSKEEKEQKTRSYAPYIELLLKWYLQKEVCQGVFFNINFPYKSENIPLEDVSRHILVTRQGKRYYQNRIEKKLDPDGRPYYWLTGERIQHNHEVGTDCWAIEENKISITPLTIESTHKESYKTYQAIDFF